MRGFVFVVMGCLGLAGDIAPAADAPDSLTRVFGDYWDDVMRRHPLEATIAVGDHRFDDRVNDATPEAFDAWVARLREFDRRLAVLRGEATGSTRVPSETRIAAAVLQEVLQARIALAPFGDHLMPLAPLLRAPTDIRSDDLHLLFVQLGEFHPAATAGDVENFLIRLGAFPRLVDGLIATMRRGMAEKRTPPRVAMARLAPQLRALGEQPADESPLGKYIGRLPADWPESRREAAADRIRAAIARDVAPAYRRLGEFVTNTYLPACRESVGLRDTPDGREHYVRLARAYTTTDLTPEQIHQTGLAEVERVRGRMNEIRRRVGFEGDLAAFLTRVRDDPALKARDADAIVERHRAILREVNTVTPRLFGRIPSAEVVVQAFDPVRARSSPAAEYLPMPADGSRPGIFFVNTLEPQSRPTYSMQALAYHEAVPGHHFQGAIAAEATGRPAFRRFFYLPACDEGWALYAEGLGEELGLYRDPYAELGRHVYDAQRCVRLVVDTGIHALGWSRERAVAYFAANTSIPSIEIENEVDRYIVWPGQALAYKMGDLEIRKIRAELEKRQGARFDVRAFHDRLLGFGSLPLSLLRALMLEGVQ